MTALQKLAIAAGVFGLGTPTAVMAAVELPDHPGGVVLAAVLLGGGAATMAVAFGMSYSAEAGQLTGQRDKARRQSVAAPNGVPPGAPIAGEVIRSGTDAAPPGGMRQRSGRVVPYEPSPFQADPSPEPAAQASPEPVPSQDPVTRVDLTAVDVTQPMRRVEPGPADWDAAPGAWTVPVVAAAAPGEDLYAGRHAADDWHGIAVAGQAGDAA